MTWVPWSSHGMTKVLNYLKTQTVFIITKHVSLLCHPGALSQDPGNSIFIKFGFHNLGSMVKPRNDNGFTQKFRPPQNCGGARSGLAVRHGGTAHHQAAPRQPHSKAPIRVFGRGPISGLPSRQTYSMFDGTSDADRPKHAPAHSGVILDAVTAEVRARRDAIGRRSVSVAEHPARGNRMCHLTPTILSFIPIRIGSMQPRFDINKCVCIFTSAIICTHRPCATQPLGRT